MLATMHGQLREMPLASEEQQAAKRRSIVPLHKYPLTEQHDRATEEKQ